jgi:aminopeptidase
MLTKKQTEKYADILVWGIKECRRRKFKKGDIAQIKYDPLGVNLAKEVYKRLLNAGLHIVLDVTIPIDVEKYYYDNATNSQLDFLGPWRHQLYKNLNGNIYICAPESLTYLKDCDPKKISRSSLATKPLRKITEKRENKRLFGWTLCVYPTQALADESGMTLKQYTNQIIRACYLNEEEPVTKWEEIYREMKRIIKWLNRLTKNTSYFHVESKRMDLKIDPGDERRWQSGNGANIPSFELFISPNWRGTRGVQEMIE